MLTEEMQALARAIAEECRKNPPVPRKWLSLQEAAAYLGIAEQTLSLRIKQDRAPRSTLISRKARRFSIEDLDQWVMRSNEAQGLTCAIALVEKCSDK
jgi:predicted DNA-binding transcriptional regulator AlpA